MPNYLYSLQHLATHNLFLVYFIIYFFAILLGDIPAFIAFWLALQGVLGHWGVPLLIITITFAYITGDAIWYSIGRLLRGTRLGETIKNHLPHHARLEHHIHANAEKWIFLSKFIISSSFPILFLVGWTGYDFKKTMKRAGVAVLAWMPVLTFFALLLFTSLTPLRAIAVFKHFEILFSVGLVLFIIANSVMTHMLRRMFDTKDE